MASNSTQLGCSNTGYKYTLSVNWSESETNIANNTTKITASGSLSASNVGFDARDSSNSCYLKLYWHDNNKNTDTLFATSSAFTTCGMGYATRSVSGSITVTHKSDGSLSGYVKVYFYAPTTSGGWSPSSSSCNTEWTTCTTIARASGITSVVSPTEYLGQPVTISIDRKSSDFVHEIQYKFEGSDWIVAQQNVGTSCTFTPSVDLSKYVPNSVSGTLRVCIATFKDKTQIGEWVYSSITLWVPEDCKPTMENLQTTLITNGVPSIFYDTYIQGISQVKVTAGSAKGSYNSTITSYSISGPNLDVKSSSGTSEVLTAYGDMTYKCTATDSRGRTVTKYATINVNQYYYPSLSISKAIRCNTDGTTNKSGTNISVIISYSYASIDKKNYIASKICSCNESSNDSFASGVAFVLSASCSLGGQYTLTASVTDALGNKASVSTTIPTAYRVFNVNKAKTGLAIGKYSEKEAFEVDMDSEFNKGVRVEGTLLAKNGMTQGYGRLASINTFYGDTSLRYFLATSSCKEGKPPEDAAVLHLPWDNGLWDLQIAVSENNLYIRSGNGSGDWKDWKKMALQSSVNDITSGNTNVVVKSSLLDFIYPVGSVYFSRVLGNVKDATCPIKSVLGGTWQLVEVSIHSMYHSYFAIDVSDGKFQNNKNIQLFQSNGGAAQRWVHGLWNFGSYNANTTNAQYDPPKSPGGQGWLCIWVRTA